MAGLFSVVEYYADGAWQYMRQGVSAEEAVRCAIDHARRPAAQIGVIARVIITDADDFITFDWRAGEGLVFPTRKDLADA